MSENTRLRVSAVAYGTISQQRVVASEEARWTLSAGNGTSALAVYERKLVRRQIFCVVDQSEWNLLPFP